jgi:hypothetical protein
VAQASYLACKHPRLCFVQNRDSPLSLYCPSKLNNLVHVIQDVHGLCRQMQALCAMLGDTMTETCGSCVPRVIISPRFTCPHKARLRERCCDLVAHRVSHVDKSPPCSLLLDVNSNPSITNPTQCTRRLVDNQVVVVPNVSAIMTDSLQNLK